MPKYKVIYEYVTRGFVEVEADSVKEAKENYLSADLDTEQVIKHRVIKVTKI